MAVTPTLAASIYLNSAPVVYAFHEGSQADRCVLLRDAAPSRCARLLELGVADAALVPSIEYLRIPGLAVARGVCVGARRAVRSVLLVSRRPIEAIRTVAIDISSRTSATLVRIILERFLEVRASFLPAAPDLSAMLSRCDAGLIIGDPAMRADTRGYQVYDLAELWQGFTGLPFVFAFWAVRRGRVAPGSIDFVAAREEGVAAAPLLAERFEAKLGLPREGLLEYLTSSIHYELDDECLLGLSLFYRYAAEAGLVPAPQPLRFWPE